MDNYSGLRTNLTMLMDFYEITMANGYFTNGYRDRIAYFDMFFRHVPNDGGFAIMAGVQQLIEYFDHLHFSEEDIAYLASTQLFSIDFLDYLRTFKFSCDVWAVPEGTPIFPMEPIVTVRGPAIEAQFIETMILLTINHQSLIATKANRIVRAAQGRPVMEFMGHVPLTSVAAAVQQVHFVQENLIFLQWEQWHIVGYNCSIVNWKHFVHMPGLILLSVHYW